MLHSLLPRCRVTFQLTGGLQQNHSAETHPASGRCSTKQIYVPADRNSRQIPDPLASPQMTYFASRHRAQVPSIMPGTKSAPRLPTRAPLKTALNSPTRSDHAHEPPAQRPSTSPRPHCRALSIDSEEMAFQHQAKQFTAFHPHQRRKQPLNKD